jgi:hypothetical protein
VRRPVALRLTTGVEEVVCIMLGRDIRCCTLEERVLSALPADRSQDVLLNCRHTVRMAALVRAEVPAMTPNGSEVTALSEVKKQPKVRRCPSRLPSGWACSDV